ncbi:D-2-hydroxyacid dehydrogenase [Paramicrobacterium agarici]|uniref:Phosphoglycerate dehydrogenase-like enzyme n=1 Tax=Paramicrobacterium agarici TaxID=630514 RepID=A0A2A9DYZ2_9MICO|nr:D-2-hydroxyacid dehydrogenase [Microbacterium agarici]PFG31814.1 phosphoglycerate dehydrogenase-like enzyme [Microbacterium agarici]TQO21711.1 phosphoglycerate dehydrogenase-like enzyme [Microbacterium agarici]
MAEDRLRVAVATPLSDELCAMIQEREPRVQMVRDPELLPPMRHPADFAGDPDFSRTGDEQRRFEEIIDGADALYGIPDVDPKALKRAVDANSRLRWVQVMAAGGGGQVKAAGLEPQQLERVSFTTSAGVHGGPLAEFALFGLLAGAKSLPRLQRQQSAHVWSGRWEMAQLSEQTVLVLGLGGIGTEIARLLSAFGATVIGTARHEREVEGVDEFVHPDSIADVAHRVDAAVVALPGTSATEKLVGERFFAAAQRGLTVVNVGRGTVIDEDALVRALDDGTVGFAALDVVASEPLSTDSPLWDHPNVLLSPHTAALNAAEERRIAELFADNATRLLDGRPLRNLVDTVDFY